LVDPESICTSSLKRVSYLFILIDLHCFDDCYFHIHIVRCYHIYSYDGYFLNDSSFFKTTFHCVILFKITTIIIVMQEEQTSNSKRVGRILLGICGGIGVGKLKNKSYIELFLILSSTTRSNCTSCTIFNTSTTTSCTSLCTCNKRTIR
jgi:hypothetical protein